jgi:sulfur-carrier protein adenylyltransferase/sulfurtransferase
MKYQEAFERQIQLNQFGKEAQEELGSSKVAIIGMGGLGCPIALYLAAMGIGELRLVDGDVVSASNLHRQILYGWSEVGKPKVRLAGDFLSQRYPWVTLKEWAVPLDEENAQAILEGVDLVLDATDSQYAKFLVASLATLYEKTWVYGAVNGFEAQISTFSPQCESQGFFALMNQPDESGWVQTCAEQGVLGVLPGIAGLEMALEAVRVLTSLGDNLMGKMLFIDGWTGWRKSLKLGASRGAEKERAQAYLEQRRWGLTQLPKPPFRLIDLRNPEEFTPWGVAQNIPMDLLEDSLGDFSPEEAIVLVCSAGIRSKKACRMMREKGFTQVFYWRGHKTEATLG